MIQTILGLLLLVGGAALFYFALQQQIGGFFILYLLASLLLLAPLPLVIYIWYSLLTAGYSVGRDGLRFRWGLRSEDIPLDDVEWLRSASDFKGRLPFPLLRIPGAILGARNTQEFGLLEYMASGMDTMLLIATRRKVYAISPADPAGFASAFQAASEMGSLVRMQPVTMMPAAFLQRVWTDRLARIVIVAGLGFSLGLLIAVSLIVPTLASASLGFAPGGTPQPPGPAARLLLLPVLGLIVFLVDLLAGLFFYRSEDNRLVSYMVWAASSITAILLLISLFFVI
ncbi:MAG: hypothetical protein HGA86_04290 [Anaerolineaceae bacterium]|nr:hypothetical protein [Anaerolineaceae bacterium]